MALLGEMPTVGIAPNHFSYKTTMEVCGNRGQGQRAVEFSREMSAEVNIMPGVIIYNAAITACGENVLWDQLLVL